ncbi:MAG TPA: hypothetical protein VFW96_07165, partial [Thermomicrobiales bacterium]|nr:hypothetical protein [Thermomicrobiales bacterium]
GSHVRTYVARCRGAPCAFVQARGRSAPHKWDIVYLAAARRGPAAAPGGRLPLWTALLDYTTVAAGRRGIQRLYAKLPGDGEAAEAFRAAGYVRYGEETLYHLYGGTALAAGAADGAEEAAPLRPQTPADTWALHRLYTLTAPKPVQYAEAYTSHRWEVAEPGLWRGRRGVREWGLVVEQGHDVVVYCRVGRQRQRIRLAFVFEPEGRALLAPVLDAVLREVAPGRDDQVYCTVQEFQQELAPLLEARGFERLGAQELLVRYTTVSVRTAALPAWPLREKVRAGVPAHL